VTKQSVLKINTDCFTHKGFAMMKEGKVVRNDDAVYGHSEEADGLTWLSVFANAYCFVFCLRRDGKFRLCELSEVICI